MLGLAVLLFFVEIRAERCDLSEMSHQSMASCFCLSS